MKNGVPGLEIVERDRLRELEPNISPDAVAALWAPTGAIVCPFGLTIALAENAAANGVRFRFDTKVASIRPENGHWVVETDRGTFETRAVVNAAGERGLEHRERHAAVEYIVAHGIASSIEGRRAIIGSAHFVFEDEGAQLESDIKERIESQMQGLSPLYLAVDGTVVGVLGIEDPLKPGVREAIADLHALGVKHVVMLTGDSERTAERIAREAGVDEFKAELLPEDKYAYVEQIKREGRRVAMVGDGVNDSPALGLADVGLAMGGGSDIAKEVADIILADTDLAAIVRLRRMSQGLIDRLTSSYSKVMLTNSALLALGITGAITPQASSLLHNGSTIAYSLNNAKAYLR